MTAKRAGNASRGKTQAQVSEERQQCYQLRLAGVSTQAIAKQLGISVGTVHNRVTQEIQSREEPLAEEMRKMQLDRLDDWLVRLNAQVRDGRQVARSIEVALRVEERRAKLMGIDAPERMSTEVSYTPSSDLEQRVQAARALLQGTDVVPGAEL